MEDDSVTSACVLHSMNMVRRWVAELDGRNRIYAFELMNLVMAGELTTHEAFSLLDNA